MDRSLAHLGTDVESATLRTAAAGAGSLGLLTGAVAVLVGAPVLAGIAILAGVTLGTLFVAVPVWCGTIARSRGLGAAPMLVGLAVLRGRVDPTPERAADFAATHARGPLAATLRQTSRAARGRPDTGWRTFGAEWGEFAPGVRRATSMLLAGMRADSRRRQDLFDRAFEAVLDGTADRAAAAAVSLRGPTSALYAFGVVLPLALVATVPALSGIDVPLVAGVVIVYDLVLPVTTAIAAAWILSKRPVAFPAQPISASHPDVPDRRGIAIGTSLFAGALAWLLADAVGVPWLRWVTVPGATIGVGLWVWYRPVVAVRRRVTDLEAGLPDALAVVGGAIKRGRAPERAIAVAGEELSGPAGRLLGDAARRSRRLGVGMRRSFQGECGVLSDVPSRRTEAVAELLALAATDGEHGGDLLIDFGDHLDRLGAVERRSRRQFAPIVGTLRSTACCFGPIIGGTTIGLAARIGTADPGGEFEIVATTPLGIAVGWYILVLAAILSALAVGLDRGLDRSLIGYHAGVALAAASLLYPTAFIATGLFL